MAAEPLAAVARAVGLREGPRGVEEVLRHLAGPAPAIRRLSRRTSIPVPVVAAICNELCYRVSKLFPQNFIGAAMLPQSPCVEKPRRRLPVAVS